MRRIHRALPAIAAVLALFAVAATAAEPLLIRNFGELLTALKSGERVRAVFQYKAMTLTVEGKPEDKVPDAVGGMGLDTYEYFAAGAVGNKEGFLSFSQTQPIRHPRHGYVLNYIKVSVYESNAVKILAQYLDPKTYEVKMDETFTTTMGDGRNSGGAFFYRQE
jgi:hypothetical protein